MNLTLFVGCLGILLCWVGIWIDLRQSKPKSTMRYITNNWFALRNSDGQLTYLLQIRVVDAQGKDVAMPFAEGTYIG